MLLLESSYSSTMFPPSCAGAQHCIGAIHQQPVLNWFQTWPEPHTCEVSPLLRVGGKLKRILSVTFLLAQLASHLICLIVLWLSGKTCLSPSPKFSPRVLPAKQLGSYSLSLLPAERYLLVIPKMTYQGETWHTKRTKFFSSLDLKRRFGDILMKNDQNSED